MSEQIMIHPGAGKDETYQELLPQIRSLIEGETDLVANLANVAAALKETFGLFWVGFYLVKGSELVLGPFQGPVACTRIGFGRGVCGTAWREKRIVVVPDVDKFPGHIACSSRSRSEIVVPLIHQDEVWAVLDIDSESLGSFDACDAFYLNEICSLLTSLSC
ncbi:MAG TPA: GAF domain-containing protein [Candidatus Gallibacteroides avistercoris]|uniref:GAF domain-containing protein n=1 Tax=Candidatus Gallibacteroides avistercoris TaxID=2840833 RepID=A0A9D1SDF7_9BACT|nr:GAF domain-containing protein [Candidatus Gallibacteroides avistercoris]